ncbi:MAG: alpha/beta fold hydrolase [Acidobacteria bacterium]|nr:alpha/beta fold hydrolase [Acidobacteriota bacterium]
MTSAVLKKSYVLAAALVAAALVFAAPLSAATAKKKKPRAKKPRAAQTRKAEPPPVPRPPDPNRVTIRSADGVRLAATWRPNPARSDAPALLLVHDFARERREWTALADELASLGFATLALDLRGHGESTQQDGKPNVRPSPTLLRSPSGFPRDVEAACAWLRERAPAVGVLGVSVGGSLALLATASSWADAAVAVSVNTDKLPFLAGGRPTHAKGTLVLATEKDPGRKASAEEIHSAAEEPKGMKLYPGAAHNFALFTAHPDAKQLAFAWLTARLTASPAEAPGGTP